MKLIKLLLFLLSFNISAQSIWQPLPNILSNSSGQRFDDVFFLNENLGWAANGFFAAVYKTTDGGLNWTEQLNETDLSGGYYFRNIEFINETIGFLGTLNGVLFRTIDGGENWAEVTNINPNPNAICGLDAVGSSTIYGCGAYFSPAYIIKSTDNGETWSFIDMSAYANALVEILFIDELIGFASGRDSDGAVILKTTDGGINWEKIYNSNIVGEYVWKLQTLENTNIMFGAITSVAPNNGQLIKSVDGGVNWQNFESVETDIQAVGFISENRGWMGGFTTGFHETTDGGQTWTDLNVGNNLNRIFVINSNIAYASGTTIYKFTEDLLNIEEFSPNKSHQHLDIKIHQNPVENNLELTINFESDDNILIELYDINGKFIKQLSRSTIHNKTSRAYKFNVSDLSTGPYFVDFHNNSGRSSLKFIKK